MQGGGVITPLNETLSKKIYILWERSCKNIKIILDQNHFFKPGKKLKIFRKKLILYLHISTIGQVKIFIILQNLFTQKRNLFFY